MIFQEKDRQACDASNFNLSPSPKQGTWQWKVGLARMELKGIYGQENNRKYMVEIVEKNTLAFVNRKNGPR
jgi:hypothetical protein